MEKVRACIHSLDGEVKEVTIIERRQNDYIVDYEGVRCTAIFNPFVGLFYADDKYGVIK